MGKNDLESARRQGMAYAFKIASERGIDGLEEELRYRNITETPIGLEMKYVNEFVERLKKSLYAVVKAVALLALRDEFGFGNKRLMRFYKRFESNADSIINNYATFQDFADCLKDETGISVDMNVNCGTVSVNDRIVVGLGKRGEKPNEHSNDSNDCHIGWHIGN